VEAEMFAISENLVRDVYAHFGRAYYFCECVHRALCAAEVLVDFPEAYGTTAPRLEEKLSIAYSRTMGGSLEAVGHLLPDDLREQVRAAVAKRNFLAHHFWFDRVHLMSSDAGLVQLREELSSLADEMTALDETLTAFLQPRWQSLGVTEEVIDDALADVLAGADSRLPNKRRTRKVETIVRVWDAPTEGGRSYLVFETDDGLLLQLCEAGLGWARPEMPGDDWKKHALFSPWLPATVHPRPKHSEHWRFEIPLSTGAVLVVWPGGMPHSYRWSMRTPASQNPPSS
jgi:hypothetical protein